MTSFFASFFEAGFAGFVSGGCVGVGLVSAEGGVGGGGGSVGVGATGSVVLVA